MRTLYKGEAAEQKLRENITANMRTQGITLVALAAICPTVVGLPHQMSSK